MLTGIKVQITAESSIVIGRLCCYLHFCPGQNDKLPEVLLVWLHEESGREKGAQ